MHEMIVESLNIGLPKKEIFHGKEVTTGIGKRPVSGAVNLGELGYEGDGVADTKNHGGIDKAVCVYSLDHYAYWEETLGINLPPAAFGENLTVSNLKEDSVCIGDIFQLGTAVVQVSQPRQPCQTLAARFGRKDLQEGIVKAGSPLILRERDSHKVSIAFANYIFHHDRKNRNGIEKILAVPALSGAWQRSLQELSRK